MGGIEGVQRRSDDRLYCGYDDEDSEPVCREPGRDRPERLVCIQASEKEGAQSSSDAQSPINHSSASPDRRQQDADYWTLSVGVGAIIGVSAAVTLDRHGHVYVGVGAGVSLSPTVTASLVAGEMKQVETPTEEQLNQLLAGDAVSLSAGVGRGAGIMSSPGGTAIEQGLYIPQAGFTFEHSWEIYGEGPKW
jgi:hypothetical protein